MPGKNIFQLWMDNGKALPFTARRNSWAERTYVVVEIVKLRRLPYGTAYGQIYRSGSPIHEHEGLAELPEIELAGTYTWEMAGGVSGMKRETVQFEKRPLMVLSKQDRFDFGKYRGNFIEHILQRDPGYVKWALKHVEYFAVDPDLLAAQTCDNPQLKIGRKMKELNRTKIDSADCALS